WVVGSTPSRSRRPIRSTCSRIPDSSPTIVSTSSSARRSRARRATCRTWSRSITGRGLGRVEKRQPPHRWRRGQYCPRRMEGPGAERFVVFNLRLLAITFAVVGVLFIAVPSGVLDVISDVGEWFGNDTRAPHGDQQFWLALAFAYMVVIA